MGRGRATSDGFLELVAPWPWDQRISVRHLDQCEAASAQQQRDQLLSPVDLWSLGEGSVKVRSRLRKPLIPFGFGPCHRESTIAVRLRFGLKRTQPT